MTLKIDAADCLLSFYELPLKVKYTDARGDISTDFTKITLNLSGCDEITTKYEPIKRPYFDLTAEDTLEFTLEVGESWTWSIPEPKHEDDSTDDHTFAFKVSTVKPMTFMEYFDKTLLLDIAANATTIEDAGDYEIKVTLEDENEVASSDPIILRITVVGETEAEAEADEENADDDDDEDEFTDGIVNQRVVDLSYLKDIVNALTSEKEDLKAKFNGSDFDPPKVKIREVTQHGVIHFDFSNKMQLREPQNRRERRLQKAKKK